MNDAIHQLVEIPVDGVRLEGELIVPESATGLVVFSHGSGSSRKSPRNNYVASVIRERQVGTLLFDLLTEEEDMTYETRFDIPLLTERLLKVTEWLEEQDATKDLQYGYFGSSTGAASALRAAARLDPTADAVVSRGGRVDLAADVLDQVEAPTLFLIGGRDYQVLDLNREAYEKLQCEKNLEVIGGAGHLFEEPGTLDRVAELAADWFTTHLQ
ncbi:dienelactone hydrolase family protein [Haladaptatus pallidirubidus]|uniref:Dienelactone hydrolase family protein n=1 Tax=Haladaptatus pallidirubidus TaxID=1008152 RepID=A0AAV3UQW1_9EURY|nr:dienelactone hydrolase family protein [Haladaptatus pallidirubidus]